MNAPGPSNTPAPSVRQARPESSGQPSAWADAALVAALCAIDPTCGGVSVRAGVRELGPHLIGEDPRQLAKLNHRMDAALKGHPYVKSGIDIACWDILGQALGVPVWKLLGGRARVQAEGGTKYRFAYSPDGGQTWQNVPASGDAIDVK